MTNALIFRPSKTPTQSGKAMTKMWIIAFQPSCAKLPDQLMGWVTGEDMVSDQVRLKFKSKDAAIRFAEKVGLNYEIKETKVSTIKPKSYADNFKPDRIQGNWSH